MTRTTDQNRKTATATAAAARKAADRRADWLHDRGWVCVPPELVDQATRALLDAGIHVPAEHATR